MKRLTIHLVIWTFVLVAFGGGGYYFQQQARYVITDRAQVWTDTVSVVPPAVGKLTEWTVHTGDRVERGAQLGMQEATQPGVAATPITSPISGVVLLTHAVPGQVVPAGRPLAVVADLSQTHVLAYVDEKDVTGIRLGQSVEIKLASDRGHTMTGRVAEIGKKAGDDSASRSEQAEGKSVKYVPVKITVDQAVAMKLIPGVNASIKLERS
ncbi:CusB/HlyD membrane fusion family barrel-sandwich protein [Laceyella sediminis]|uniref:CusB/HlyD membrane fusion family barrel-sandwich protein n=1 Tax=Laceyella sediminis TaxID=573074 RepID=A0ABX5EJL4_9BACL|nr:HlyD family efflux transporter periplasmic adaptor subunit [Laceyella sediminis]PRZ11895.1 CusB/HlyD membrane fusion family barrel-sandwich protein [Laceyella sediminis]